MKGREEEEEEEEEEEDRRRTGGGGQELLVSHGLGWGGCCLLCVLCCDLRLFREQRIGQIPASQRSPILALVRQEAVATSGCARHDF